MTTPIMNLQGLAEIFLSCLCNAVATRAKPPLHCCFRLGDEIAQDADLYADLCCQGLAYVSLGEIYPVVNSFPEQSIVTQADQVCAIPSWAVSLRAGIIRCAPVGTNTTMPTCADWNAAMTQHILDAQSLAEAACCLKAGWIQVEPGLSFVIGPSSTTTPQGGCTERSITVQVQTIVCPDC